VLIAQTGSAQDPAAAPPADPAAAPPPAAEAAPAAAPAPPALHDIRQVQIQVWISETTEQGIRNVGANLNFTRFVDGQEDPTASVKQVTTNLFDTRANFDPVTLPRPSLSEDLIADLPPDEAAAARTRFNSSLRDGTDETNAPGIQTRSGAGFTGSLIDDRGTIDMVFRSVERNAEVDLISKPEMLVVNGGTASIKAGGNVPFQTVEYDVYGNPQLAIKWEDVGVNLSLIPQIMANNSVRLTLSQLDVTDIDRIENIRGVDLPVFSKRSQTGVVIVPDQQTLVIGGLSSRVVRRSDRQVPFLGQLPVIGAPFRNRRSEANITHLLVFVSPTVVDIREINKKERSALEFWRSSGDRWEHVDRIQDEIELMDSEL
jgi:type II secretory pathway component GspD/PulD (secretin)